MNNFRKEERLCSKVHLDLLFKNGSSFLFYPFRITFLRVTKSSNFPVQVVITVSKKRYKRAVDRNLLKRRIKESYRFTKQDFLYSSLHHEAEQVLVSVQYIGKKIYEFDFILSKMQNTLLKLVKKMNLDESD